MISPMDEAYIKPTHLDRTVLRPQDFCKKHTPDPALKLVLVGSGILPENQSERLGAATAPILQVNPSRRTA